MNKRVLSSFINSISVSTTQTRALGAAKYYADEGASLCGITLGANSGKSNSTAVYPNKSDFIHAGDRVTLEDGGIGYRFNIRVHSDNYLDANEFLRICRITHPELIAGEDEDFFYLNCPETYDPIDIVTRSYAVLPKAQYTFRAGAVADESLIGGYFPFNLQMSHIETSRLFIYQSYSAQAGVTHISVVGLPYDTPRALQYVYMNDTMSVIPFEKKSFGIFVGYLPEIVDKVEPYYGIAREIILREPLRSISASCGSASDEYSLFTGKITRNVEEVVIDGNTTLYLMNYNNYPVFYCIIKDNEAPPSGPVSTTFLKDIAGGLDDLVGTNFSCIISNSGWHLYFTLSSEYDTTEKATAFFTENPLTVLYKRLAPKYEDAPRVLAPTKRGTVVVEAATENPPYVTANYTYTY